MTKKLLDYYTGAAIRKATPEECQASIEAARWDGGAGVILIDEDGDILSADEPGADEAWRCYVA